MLSDISGYLATDIYSIVRDTRKAPVMDRGETWRICF